MEKNYLHFSKFYLIIAKQCNVYLLVFNGNRYTIKLSYYLNIAEFIYFTK